jgi:SAM-dependent methyltransferase
MNESTVEHDLRKEFERRGPWVTGFAIEGRMYGGKYDARADVRLNQFAEHVPGAKRILELGCLEGGHSFALAAMPGVESVVAIEGRRANVERARFVQGLLGEKKIEFVHANLEDYDITRLDEFDAVFCVGLLYHLPAPWELVDQMARVAPAAFLWTHFADPQRAKSVRGGYPGWVYREWGFAFEPLSGLSPSSFWPTREALFRMLAASGYPRHTLVEDQSFHPHGPALTLVARR